MGSPTSDKMVTFKEAAKFLGLTQKKFREILDNREGPLSLGIGKHQMFLKTHLVNWGQQKGIKVKKEFLDKTL